VCITGGAQIGVTCTTTLWRHGIIASTAWRWPFVEDFAISEEKRCGTGQTFVRIERGEIPDRPVNEAMLLPAFADAQPDQRLRQRYGNIASNRAVPALVKVTTREFGARLAQPRS